LSGCKDSQTAADAFSKTQNKGVGAFTDSFLYCLAEQKYTSGLIPLYSSIVKYITSSGFSQIPILSCSSPIPEYIFSPVSSQTGASGSGSGGTNKKEMLVQRPGPGPGPGPVSLFDNFYSHHVPKTFGKRNRIRMSLVLT
jgi:hypothetical protein